MVKLCLVIAFRIIGNFQVVLGASTRALYSAEEARPGLVSGGYLLGGR